MTFTTQHPHSEIRNPGHSSAPQLLGPERIRNPKAERRVGNRASVVECGGPASLFSLTGLVRPAESASGLAQSKTQRSAVAFCLRTSAFCLRAFAQYAIDWSTMDGGGASTGGVDAVSGTLGQPDATPVLHGGNSTLTGGFWSLIAAVQTPGAPFLTVFRTVTNSVVVSWPLVSAEDWVLEATNALPSVVAPWPVIPPPYQTNGPNLQFIEPAPVGNKFYRLDKP